MTNQKYNSLVFPNLQAFIARPEQYKGAKRMIKPPIKINIGIKAKTKNN